MQGLNEPKSDFTLNMILSGSVNIPTFFLRHYRDLDISDQEMMVLIHIMSMRQNDRDSYPSVDRLADLMQANSADVKSMLASLMEKNILGVDNIISPETGNPINSYSLQGLIQQLARVWVAEQAKLAAHPKKRDGSNSDHGQTGAGEPLGLARIFEREFGRPLSPIEHAQIIEWCDGDRFGGEIILAALKRAVLRGILNLKYIDRILSEWDKKNLRTLREIEAAEERFQEKNTPKKGQRGDKEEKPPGNKGDKFKDLIAN